MFLKKHVPCNFTYVPCEVSNMRDGFSVVEGMPCLQEGHGHCFSLRIYSSWDVV